MRRSSSLHLNTAKQNKSSTLKRDIFLFGKAEEDARLAPCYDDNAAKRKKSRFKAWFAFNTAGYGCDFADVDVGGSQKQLRRDGVKLHCEEVY